MVNRVNRTIILAPYFRAVVSSVLLGLSFRRVKLRIIAGLIKVTTDRKKNGRIRRTLIFFFAKPSVLQRRRRNWRHHLQSQPEVLAGSFITQPVKQIHFFHCVDYSHCNDWKGIIAVYFVRFWRIAGSIGNYDCQGKRRANTSVRCNEMPVPKPAKACAHKNTNVNIVNMFI